MRINTTDPDLRTIFTRITEGSLDLQPDFQRAEVWQSPKKKLLIDTILRGWQVPPVHVVWDPINLTQEVLDGQQRLSAVRDFMSNKFKINGRIEPLDDDLVELDGLTYSQLPLKVKSRFDRYAIRIFEIVEYNQGEPGELFNRLNESLKLTSAEKRNAYVGKLRDQIKSLVDELPKQGLDSKFLGFSNQRLSYHDLFIKLCYMLESDNLTVTYTEKQLNDRARNDESFNQNIIETIKEAIKVLGKIKNELDINRQKIHITKATITTWLYFISEQLLNNSNFDINACQKAFISFEKDRYNFTEENLVPSSEHYTKSAISDLFTIFHARATSRVTTSSSLIIRDLIISIYYIFNGGELSDFKRPKKEVIQHLLSLIKNKSEHSFTNIIENYADEILYKEWK